MAVAVAQHTHYNTTSGLFKAKISFNPVIKAGDSVTVNAQGKFEKAGEPGDGSVDALWEKAGFERVG